MQTKAGIPRSIVVESQQAIATLTRISELLKHQRRHFDDAVVTHCMRLINDYVQENLREIPSEEDGASTDGGRHP
jgi:hypothetical protein